MNQAQSPKPAWLVAGWPGMGNVAIGACAHLMNSLEITQPRDLAAGDHFDVEGIEVKNGIAQAPRVPRNLLANWTNPGDGPNLVVFLAEAQPSYGKYAFCRQLLDAVADQNIERVVTFASLATQIHPSAEPGVYAATTQRSLLEELGRLEVKSLDEGQVGGLNGVLLAAANERGLPAACLLGEIPFFAAGIPNVKTSKSVLETFAAMADLQLDYSPLIEQSEQIEQALLQLLDQMESAARNAAEEGEEPGIDLSAAAPEAEEAEPALDYATRNRIESLFEEARKDRSKAMALKQVLDKHNVFEQYEDRFLDLFRRGE